MKKILTTICAAAMALTAIASTMAPAGAAAMPLPKLQSGSTDVQQVRDGRRGFYRQRGNTYYNGHRGYRNHRAGWRQHNGYWFPPAAFIAGAIIGGAIANQPTYRPAPAYRPASNAHVRWCYNRYRSYRAADNTFQPNYGPRQQCASPYMR
ncbi:BA14K family protein [Mesorhizobium sp. CGMCC 1.15528]|uniref:Lectin-like protein BA14k n=1 Tax=Mesorhizobium zhangyense TaxID=1776730 RepID=A0A7C9V9W0_9HYPH|nr:BA14K family protein [Mesorhizobium zhangyense]NGN40467.1 BA14K family protein [Mesorhizobium zhangyense]